MTNAEHSIPLPTDAIPNIDLRAKGQARGRTSPVRKGFPTIFEDGPASVDVFPQFLRGLRRPYARKGEHFSLINRDYFRSNPKAKQAFRLAYDYFREHDEELVQHISDLDQICNLLGVSSYAGIFNALAPDKRRNQASLETNRMIAKTFGFEDKGDSDKTTTVEGFGESADKFMLSHLRTVPGPFSSFSEDIGMMEEVKGTHDVVALLALMFNHGNEQVRFEAKRKLVLMRLVAEADKRDRDLGADALLRAEIRAKKKKESPEEKTDAFVRFLGLHVWRTEAGQDTERVLLVSKHEPENYECRDDVEEVPIDQAGEIRTRIKNHKHNIRKKGYYLRASNIKRRSFEFDGEIIPAGFESREYKDFLSTVEKLFRKGMYIPEAGVPDMKGWEFVVRDRYDAIALKRKLELAGRKTGSLVFIEETEDTSGGKPFSAKNPGSSTELYLLKYLVLFEGERMEIKILTYKNWVDSNNKDGVAHEEFELTRMVDSGALEALVPPLYGVGPDNVTRAIENLRLAKRSFNENSF